MGNQHVDGARELSASALEATRDGSPAPDSGEALLDALRSELGSDATFWLIAGIPQPLVPVSRGRRSRQRWVQACRLWEAAERCRHALKHLAVYSEDSGQIGCCDSIAPARISRSGSLLGQRDVDHAHRWLHTRCKLVVFARRACPTGASLQEVLHKQSCDFQTKDPLSKYEPFHAESIAEPPIGSPTVSILSVLPERVACLYSDVRNLVSDIAECQNKLKVANCCYNKVLGPFSEWKGYLARQDVLELL